MKHPTPITGQQGPHPRQRGIDDLIELIAALDGRAPRLERAGEADIARDAARLRLEAIARIAELERSQSDD